MCNNCNKDYLIVNKKYNLCNECNYIRINGESRNQVYAKRSESKPKKVYTIKQASKRQSEINKAMSEMKLKCELDAVQNDEYYCKGCGKGQSSLDKSHILSVKQRPDLQLDPFNINLFCRDCHMRWESGNIGQMVNLFSFEKDLEYIQEKDQEAFNKIITKIIEHIYWQDIPTVEQSAKNKVKKMKNILKLFSQTVAK